MKKFPRPKQLTHEKRIEWLLKFVENSDEFTLRKYPNGYRAQTAQCATRICDTALEALDLAIKDESFF